jgi:DNA-binding NarL/FixJ family response regulator
MIRVVLMGASWVWASAIEHRLAAAPGIRFAGAAPTGRAALALVEAQRPDVLLVDLPPAGAEALLALRGLTGRGSTPRVGALLDAPDPWTIAAARRAGVAAVVVKDDLSDPDALVDLVRRLARGIRVTSPAVAAVERIQPGHASGLTPRESELIGCFVQGLGTVEAAACLCVVPQRVRNMTSAIGRKLGVSGRAAIVAKVLREDRVAVPAAA